MRTFDEFNPQNDPYKIHDFGSFEIDGQTFLFQVQSELEAPQNREERGLCKLRLASEYSGVVRYPINGSQQDLNQLTDSAVGRIGWLHFGNRTQARALRNAPLGSRCLKEFE